MTPERRAELRKLREAATPGEWRAGSAWTDCVMVPHHEGMAGPGGERVLLRMNANDPAWPHQSDAALIPAAVNALVPLLDALDAAEKRVAELEAFGAKVNAIRNSIVGMHGFSFSKHAYPLVEALDAAGFVGLGYSEERANPATLVARVRELEAALRSYLMAHPIRCSCAGCKALEGGK